MAELVSDAPGAAEKSKETFEPPMSLAQSVFRHGRNPTPASEKEILDLVTQRQMAPYYARVCAAFGISKDESLYAKMADAKATEEQKTEYQKVKNQADAYSKDELWAVFQKYQTKPPETKNDLKETVEAINACNAAGVKLMTALQRRFGGAHGVVGDCASAPRVVRAAWPRFSSTRIPAAF